MESMKTFKPTPVLRNLALAGAVSLFTACMTESEKTSGYQSDGQSAYLASETDQMGQVYDQIPARGAAKAGAGRLTITGERVIEPFAYHEECACFVRTASYEGMNGYARERIDSVTLLDAADAPLSAFEPALIAKIVHTRDVARSKGAKEANVRFDVTVEIKSEGGAKVGVWNGTMAGDYNGHAFKSASLAQVVRAWENGRFRFPESGTIELERPVLRYLITFLGDGKAKVRITNRLNGKIHILYVDGNYKETEPVEGP